MSTLPEVSKLNWSYEKQGLITRAILPLEESEKCVISSVL